jgi:hypothetical protein
MGQFAIQFGERFPAKALEPVGSRGKSAQEKAQKQSVLVRVSSIDELPQLSSTIETQVRLEHGGIAFINDNTSQIAG